MILKSIDYIRNIKIFTNVNHGANGLLSIEGFIIVLISALMLNETDQFADAMRSALQKDFMNLSEISVIFSSISLGLMIFIYLINAFAAPDKDHAINIFSWNIIIIFLSSSAVFFTTVFDGTLRNYFIYNTKTYVLIFIFLILSIIIACAKKINFSDTTIFYFIKSNFKSILAIYVSSALHMLIFVR
ncbi:MAG: hypothetical protein HLUCCO17_17530 [Saliniramus fredricksonii]|uniref:Uncharacterized protein n=1 Tax=Saliniramus fredricksonii TaxID=1653334 RepID=A0A0P8A0G7_9HYPH|nr:hypothetical protein [Saliniramus fredricksonii]KPQ08631.1 MAG: hypothetical protein HLUCCO17_17530 [Saliniramus fredricksonii]